jgi:hypothetical protein
MAVKTPPCAAGRLAGTPHGGMTMSSAQDIEPLEGLGLVTV